MYHDNNNSSTTRALQPSTAANTNNPAPPLLSTANRMVISSENPFVSAPMPGKDNTPTKRAALSTLKAGHGNVSVLQRLKNFVAPPRSAKKLVGGSDDIIMASPAKAPAPPATVSATASSTLAPSAKAAVMNSDDLLLGVLRLCDMPEALKCRAVSRQWRRLVGEAGLDPLEAGMKGEELDKGIQSQQLLETSLDRTKAIHTAEHCAFLGTHLSRQENVSDEMRQTLVNWVTEVHFKFKFREPCLHLALQLVDRYMAQVPTGRRKYQTVGVTGFLLGCKFEERHNPNVGDLSYITDYSSSRQDIVDTEKAMLEKLKFDLVQPKPSDFIGRFAAAGGLTAQESERSTHTFEHALILFFVDVAALNYKFCGIKPSDIAAAAVACALKTLGRPMWSKKLAYYSRIPDISYLANSLLDTARTTESACLKLKYSSSRFGGEASDGTRGVFGFVRKFLEESKSAARVVNAMPSDGVYV